MSKAVISPSVPDVQVRAELTSHDITLLEALVILAESLRLLILVPIGAGALGFSIASILPPTYASVAYLAFATDSGKPDGAKSAEALMRSPAVLDVVLKKHPQPGGSQERQRKALNKRINWVSASGADRKSPDLVTSSVEEDTPQRAQALNTDLLAAWLEETKPKSDRRARLEAQLERTESQLKAVSDLFDRLAGETPKLVLPGMQNELASSLAGLLSQRAAHIASIENLKLTLAGLGRDTIVVAPTLPDEPVWPRKGFLSVLAAAGTFFAMLLFVFFRHAWRVAKADPETRDRLTRLTTALRRGGTKMRV